jgi:hypothetical protein
VDTADTTIPPPAWVSFTCLCFFVFVAAIRDASHPFFGHFIHPIRSHLTESHRSVSKLIMVRCDDNDDERTIHEKKKQKALNLGFSAVNAIGNGIRESRQNEMIYQERAELGAAREREAEMAARIRQLELMQAQQAGGGQVAQPQIIIAQPPVMQAAQ